MTIPSLINTLPIHIEQTDAELTFYLHNGQSVRFYHSQDCCESVYIEDISGDLSSLLFKPLLQADVKSNHESCTDEHESVTYTFYTFANSSSVVDVRWCGSSNGYYSESVDIDIESFDLHSRIPPSDLAQLLARYPELLL